MKLKILSIVSILAISSMAHADSILFTQSDNFYAGANVSYDGEADIKNDEDNGKAKFTNFRVYLGNPNIHIQYKRTNVDFSLNVPNEEPPFEHLNYVSFDFRGDNLPLSSTMDIFYGVNLGFGFESDFNLTENYNINPRLSMSYKFNNNYAFYLGATAFINEAENDFLPIIGFQVFDNGRDEGFSGSVGYPLTKLNYRFNKNFSVNTTLLVNKELYQLKDNSSLAREGYLYDESVGASLGVTYNFDNHSSVNFGIRSIFDRKFTAYDSSGNKKDDLEFDPSYGFYLDFDAKF